MCTLCYFHFQQVPLSRGGSSLYLDESIGYLIAKAHKSLKKKHMEILSEFGLTPPQFGVLKRLYEEDGRSASELVDRLFSDRSTIMAIIDKLEEKDFVRREPDRLDRRVNRIFLTEKAGGIQPDLLAKTEGLLGAVSNVLTPKENKSLVNSLNKLYRFAMNYEEKNK